MKLFQVFVIVSLILLAAPVSAEVFTKIDPISWDYEVKAGCAVNFTTSAALAIDGNIGTAAVTNKTGTCVAFKAVFPPYTTINKIRGYNIDHQEGYSIHNAPFGGHTWEDSDSFPQAAWKNFTMNGTSGRNTSSTGTVWLNSWNYPTNLGEMEFYGTLGPTEVPAVNFTGYPLDGYNPLKVDFTIQNSSQINATGAFFTWGDGQTETVYSSLANHTYQNAGIYSVGMSWYNLSGTPGNIMKTNYILASIPTGMIVNLDVKDAISGALIQDSTVSIKNTTTGVWRNTTAPTGLVYFSTTDPGYLYPLSQNQSITLAANKTGYKDASETFNIPYNNYRARLFLMPTTITNATGAGTVVANVIRNVDGLTISGISVVMDTGQIGTTNSAGAVTLYNVTAGTRYATVTDPDGAYQSTKYAFTLIAGETKLISIQMVKVGETPVPTFGAPTITPAPGSTYDPNNPDSPVYGNYSTRQINEQGGAGVLGMLMQLIQLWPLVVLGILFKFMKSAFS